MFRSEVENVRIDVLVTQGGEPITDLTAKDLVVYDVGQPQPIVYFGREAEPLSLLLLLDVSGSVRKYIEQIASVTKESLRFLRPRDRVQIMIFARESKVQLPWTDSTSVVAEQLRSGLRDESLGAGTNINEALLAAAASLEDSAGEGGRRAVLIVTDNAGLNYKSPDAPVVEAMHSADAVVNAIVVGKGKRPEPAPSGLYRNPDFTQPDVFGISEQTGGEAVQAEKAGQAFARMIERIRTRYSLHYRKPADAAAGFRRVEVDLSAEARLRYPQAELRYRRGYKVR